jgi:hypothetical protein
MLFLLNDTVLELGDLASIRMRIAPGHASLKRGVKLGNELMFAAENIHAAHPEAALAVASEIAFYSEANCALFVRPAHAKHANEILYRLADAPITTLGFLLSRQNQHGPSVTLANRHVWTQAHATKSA